MITQVLFITGNMEFAVSIKAALERTGAFEVHPFSQVDAAYEYLIDNPHDVAIIDFTIPDIRVDVVVDRLRGVHPFLAIVATPRQPDEVIRLLKLQNSINVPFTARAIIPLLDKAAADAKRLMALPTKPINRHPEPQPSDDDTPVLTGDGDEAGLWQQIQNRELEDAEFQEILNTIDPNAPPAPSKTQKGDFDNLVNSMRKEQPRQPLPTRQQQYVDLILKGGVDQPSEPSGSTPTPGETPIVIEQDKRNPFKQREAPPSPPARSEEDSRRVFRKLAEEEPPMPSFEESLEESGTVTDLFVGVNDSSFKSVMSILRGEAPVEAETPPVQTDDFFSAVDSAYEKDQPANWNVPPIDLPEAGSFFDKTATGAAPQDEHIRSSAMYDFDSVKPVEDAGSRDVSDIPARKILEETLDDSKWLDSFSLEELIANIERQLPSHKPRVQPLPSWIKESSRKRDPRHPRGVLPLPPETAEPEFLDRLPSTVTPIAKATQPPPSDLPEMPPVTASDAMSLSERFADQATQLSKAQEEVPPDVQSMETEWLQAPPRPRTPRETFQRRPLSPVPEAPKAPDTFPESLPDSMPEMEAFSEEVFGEEGVTTQQFADTAQLGDVWESVSPFIMEETDAEADDNLFVRDVQGYEAQESEAYTLPRFNTEEFNTEFERLAAFDFAVRQNPNFAREAPVGDPYLAQLALSLTQVSLELTAEATLLTRETEQGAVLVAFAGRMASEDIEDLHGMIADDWTVNGDDARIRFISLPNSGKDYMLYSRRTVDGLILSLVFAGATPLRDIRQQGRRLVDALESVPEPGSARITTSTGTISVVTATGSQEVAAIAEHPEAAPLANMEPPPELGPTSVYACVWVIRENEKPLDEAAARAIMTGLRLQLREQYWRVQDLQARGNYVYLLADIPGETPPFMIIRDLKRRSAEIARKQHPSISENLWADSYLVVTPGRPLDEEEIQQFINFERMSLT